MLKKRDAQGLSTSVIILAVLGLIILFALLYMFMNESGKTAGVLKNCGAKGGKCDSSCDDGHEIPDTDCKTPSTICCVRI
jgi:hypothetical protein